ncbi:MAG: hypothetical protein IPN17_03435 [Deltaproteobacteria bacterium]|nr:hypothetical protein [Deltaproteobacteria bacterium]
MATTAAWASLALGLYLLPHAVFVLALQRWRPADPWARSLDVASAVALDALLVVALSWLVPFDRAVLGVRVLAALALPLVLVRAPRPQPRPHPAAVVGLVALAAGLVALHLPLSWRLVIWDRDWHIAIASMIRTSRLPYENVFLPSVQLRYHYLSDAQAAMLQVLSFNRLHPATTFSLAHDLFLFGASALLVVAASCAGLAPYGLGDRRLSLRSVLAWPVALALPLPLVFASPFTLRNVPAAERFTTFDSARFCGHSFLGFTTLAYRPHVAMATYLLVAVASAVLLRARADADDRDAPRSSLAMIASAGALALLDEASLALVAGALGLTWLLVPRAVHPSRWRGALVVAAVAAALPLVSRGLAGSLSPGGPASVVEIVPARHLALFEGVVPFTDRARFWEVAKHDWFPFYATVLCLAAAAAWTRRRDVVAAFVFVTALTVAGVLASLKVEVNHDASEGHRFLTAALVLTAAVGAFVVGAARGAFVVRAGLAAALSLSALSGWAWCQSFLRERFQPGMVPRERAWAGAADPFLMNCDVNLGSPRRSRPPVEYVEASIAVRYTGCERVRLPGRPSSWSLTVVGPTFGGEARTQLMAAPEADQPTGVVCGSDPAGREPVCAWALRALRCEVLGDGVMVRCALPREKRAAFYREL